MISMLNKQMMRHALETTEKRNSLEDKIALEWFGCTYDELDYDDKDLVECEALERMS